MKSRDKVTSLPVLNLWLQSLFLLYCHWANNAVGRLSVSQRQSPVCSNQKLLHLTCSVQITSCSHWEVLIQQASEPHRERQDLSRHQFWDHCRVMWPENGCWLVPFTLTTRPTGQRVTAGFSGVKRVKSEETTVDWFGENCIFLLCPMGLEWSAERS